jgi:hypothetical protein
MPDAHIGYELLGLTRGQWLSIAMLAIGLVCLVLWSRRDVGPVGGWAEPPAEPISWQEDEPEDRQVEQPHKRRGGRGGSGSKRGGKK